MSAFEGQARLLLGDMSAMSADMFAPVRGTSDTLPGFLAEPERLMELHLALMAAGATEVQTDRAIGLLTSVDQEVSLSKDLVFFRVRKNLKEDLASHETMFFQAYLMDVWGCTTDQLNPSAVPSEEQDASVKAKKAESSEEEPEPSNTEEDPDYDDDLEDSEDAGDEPADTASTQPRNPDPPPPKKTYKPFGAPVTSRAEAIKRGAEIDVASDSLAKPAPASTPPARTPPATPKEKRPKGGSESEKPTRPEAETPKPVGAVGMTYIPPMPSGLLYEPEWLRLRGALERFFEQTENALTRAAGEQQLEIWERRLSRQDVVDQFGYGICQRARSYIRDRRSRLYERDQQTFMRLYHDLNWEPATPPASAHSTP